MINLRYHIVSLVAVFLALGIGVIAGTTVVDQGVVRLLEREQRALQGRANMLAEQNEELRRELELWDAYGRAVLPQQMTGRLSGRTVVVLVEDQVGDDLVRTVEQAIETAGGMVSGRLHFTTKWRLDAQPSREQLALALGVGDQDVNALYAEAGARLGARLASPSDPSDERDLLHALARTGFVELAELPSGPFPTRDALGVLIASDRGSALPRPTLVVPMLRGVHGTMPFAVAEPLASEPSTADLVRAERDLRNAIATVDHLDTLIGQLALVASLQDVAAGLEAPHYGVRRRASGIAPGLEARPS